MIDVTKVPYSCPPIRECEYSVRSIESLVREARYCGSLQEVIRVLDSIEVEALTIGATLPAIRTINQKLRSQKEDI